MSLCTTESPEYKFRKNGYLSLPQVPQPHSCGRRRQHLHWRLGAMKLEHAIVARFVEHVKQEDFPEAIQEAIHKFSFR